jgi:hypothetical protein
VKIGFVLVCDAVRPRTDGLFDAIGAGHQYAAVDPDNLMLRRTCVVQVLCEPEDIGATIDMTLVLFSPEEKALVACGWVVHGIAPSSGDASTWEGRAVYAVIRIETRIDQAGRHRLVVLRGDQALAEWPLTVDIGIPSELTAAEAP